MITLCSLEKKISHITKCEYKYFFDKSNVIGVGFGYKTIGGFCTFKKCITVFVKTKIPLNKLNEKDYIPKLYKGFLTDVVECEVPTTSSLTKKIRPVVGGYSVGVDKLDPGTMGCLVADNHNDYILTCNHVIAGNSQSPVEKLLVQPAPKYGGKVPRDVVGRLSRFRYVDPRGDDNYIDGAVVETDRAKATVAIAYVGTISRINFSKIGEHVKKVGATTELTKGTIKTKYTTIIVNFLGDHVTFKNQLTTSNMSDKGDSGSILLNDKNEALGMLMADNPTISIYNTIDLVVSELNVHILRV